MRPSEHSRWSTYLGLVAVLCLFCAPLFVGLEHGDLQNDEAIYSYPVDRIIETGDWLTPRSQPDDRPWLEKPPLKFWIVAAVIQAGLLPHDESGLRFLDALFGTIAFVYVFLLGRSLAGALCGLVAVLVLFTFDPLVFDHGLRSNTMEAPLVLSYCGAMYHFARWVEGGAERSQSRHRLAVAAYFILGFMTKFVAVLFLPIVCALAFAWQGDGLRRLRARWRDWGLPALLVLAATIPWFAYQALHEGKVLWETMVGVHVYTRFTSGLHPSHLQPWHYYYSQLWRELTLAGSLWISTIGVVVLAAKAWSGRPWLARLVLVWWIVPFALMSMGTSKLFHYTYPFLPPIALGAGVAADALFRAINRGIALSVGAAVGRVGGITGRVARPWAAPAGWPRTRFLVRQLLVVGAIVAAGLGIWTGLEGRVRWEINGVEVLRNSSVARPLVIAAVLASLAGYARAIGVALALAAVAAILPVLRYPLELERTARGTHPLRAMRDCLLALQAPRPETDVYPGYGELLSNSYHYYLRRVGPWVGHDESPENDEFERRLFVPGQQALMLVSTSDYERFTRQVDLDGRTLSGLVLSDVEVLLAPGPFQACAAAAIAAGGREVKGGST